MSTPAQLEALGTDRYTDIELGAAFDRLSNTPLAAEGKVALIGLDAIRDRLEGRWPERAAQVHDHVERTLARHIGVGGWYVRISEVDYLVVQPGLSRYAAQASCLSYLRDLLEHFLGRSSPADLKVQEVISFSQRGLSTLALDPQKVTEAARSETALRSGQRAEEPDSFGAENPFMSAGGETLRVSCRLDPLFRLADFSQVGFRMHRFVVEERTGSVLSHDAISRLTTADLEKIDLATLARGFSRVQAERGSGALVLPVNFSTLSSQKARRALIECLKSAAQIASARVFCEISRLEGVPANALYSVVGMMKPFCDGVFGNVVKPQKSMAGLAGAGLTGLDFAYAGPSGEDPDRMVAALGPAIDAARLVSSRVMVLGLKTPRELGLAGILGASHATLRVREPSAG